MKKKLVIVGIDYSMKSPAMVCYNGNLYHDDFIVENLNFFSYTSDDKVKKNEYIEINTFEWGNYIQRWLHIATVFHNRISELMNKYNVSIDDVYVFLEGYSFGSNRSLIFNIAENTAILKYKLYINDIKFKIYQPKSIKKFVSGNGNAKKDMVYDSICEKLNFDLAEYLCIKKSKPPIYDFSDALSICYMGYCEMSIKNELTDRLCNDEIEFLKKKNKNGYSILEEAFIGENDECS